ncbi:MAG: hypothetical protein ABJA79_02790 [Parafilimonas sp.]
MNTKSLLIRFSIAIVICNISCTKNPSAREPENSSSDFARKAATYQNPFGVLVSETYGDPDGKRHFLSHQNEANLAHDLGVAYARIAVSNLKWAKPNSRANFLDEYKAFTNSTPSIHILLNVNWGEHSAGAQTFPGATPEYQAFIKDLTDTLTSPGYIPPAVIVVENEENNPQFHVVNTYADQAKYIDMLSYDIQACHARNLKVTNGGLTHLAVNLKVHDYFLNNLRDTARADTFAHAVFPDDIISMLYNNYFTKRRNISLYYFAAYAQLNLDYVNMHWYEPVKLAYWFDTVRAVGIDTNHISPGALVEVKNFFRDPNAVGGHQLIINELGQINPATELPQESTCNVQDLPYVIYYSGDRDQYRGIRPYRQYALHNTYTTGNPPYTLRATGIAFRNNIANIIANPYVFCIPLAPNNR